jgi:hypothetical protein
MTKQINKLSNLQRINRIMKWNYNRGICKESVVDVYRKIIKNKLKKVTLLY